MESYLIGDIEFIWNEEIIHLKKDKCMQLFQINEINKNVEEKVGIQIKFVDSTCYKKGKLFQKNGYMDIYEVESRKICIYHWKNFWFAFGVFMEDLENESDIICYVNTEFEKTYKLSMTRFFSCAGLHTKLLQRDALVFHSAYIEYHNHAILFAGPSGTGKSTQASLWKSHTGAEIINGDRTLLRKKDGIWNAYGYPCCGSSDICLNRTLPISAIVLLEQGNENKICSLSKVEKYRTILTGSEMFLWNEKEMERVSKLAEQIIEEVKMIKLICRPEEEAVTILKRALEDM